LFLAQQRAANTCPRFGQPPAFICTRTPAAYSATTCFAEYATTCLVRELFASLCHYHLVALHISHRDKCVLFLFGCTVEMSVCVLAFLCRGEQNEYARVIRLLPLLSLFSLLSQKEQEVCSSSRVLPDGVAYEILKER
jgi:hypothetical protein